MAGFAKSILMATLGMAAIIVLMNLAFFLPWYITVIETTFEVSQAVASDNYLTYNNYDDIFLELKEKPIFNKRQEELTLTVRHDTGRNAIESESRRWGTADQYYESSSRPYEQKGGTITVTMKASYPFQMKFLGNDIAAADIPVTVTMKTTGLKYYKDLYYDNFS